LQVQRMMVKLHQWRSQGRFQSDDFPNDHDGRILAEDLRVRVTFRCVQPRL
jgi:hypothetical protein